MQLLVRRWDDHWELQGTLDAKSTHLLEIPLYCTLSKCIEQTHLKYCKGVIQGLEYPQGDLDWTFQQTGYTNLKVTEKYIRSQEWLFRCKISLCSVKLLSKVALFEVHFVSEVPGIQRTSFQCRRFSFFSWALPYWPSILLLFFPCPVSYKLMEHKMWKGISFCFGLQGKTIPTCVL